MIRHVVILDFKKNAPLDIIKQQILNLKTEIKEIIHIEVGEDIGFDPASSTLCLIADFENTEALKTYATHPKHLEVINKYIKPYLLKRAVVDYYV